jgi:glucokinase
MTILGGIDIGGTKCAVVIGKAAAEGVELIDKRMYPTPPTPEASIESFMQNMAELMAEHDIQQLDAIGISCGGPLNSRKGMILSPPNLPNWDGIDVVTPLRRRFHVPVGLQNDANACALAEWKWGAGKGSRNMVFLTFGTGMGAGLILNGQLYAGTNDMAGEVGHVRLAKDGPIGYGKAGSFEGFCSGGGIAGLAKTMTEQSLQEGQVPLFCSRLQDLHAITAKKVGEAAQQGDPLALEIYRIVGKKLGHGLAMLIDVLNPERIVIGSIYGRQQQLLEPVVMEVLKEEALSIALEVCHIVPAALGESVGDLASLSVALNELAHIEVN